MMPIEILLVAGRLQVLLVLPFRYLSFIGERISRSSEHHTPERKRNDIPHPCYSSALACCDDKGQKRSCSQQYANPRRPHPPAGRPEVLTVLSLRFFYGVDRIRHVVGVDSAGVDENRID